MLQPKCDFKTAPNGKQLEFAELTEVQYDRTSISFVSIAYDNDVILLANVSVLKRELHCLFKVCRKRNFINASLGIDRDDRFIFLNNSFYIVSYCTAQKYTTMKYACNEMYEMCEN